MLKNTLTKIKKACSLILSPNIPRELLRCSTDGFQKLLGTQAVSAKKEPHHCEEKKKKSLEDDYAKCKSLIETCFQKKEPLDEYLNALERNPILKFNQATNLKDCERILSELFGTKTDLSNIKEPFFWSTTRKQLKEERLEEKIEKIESPNVVEEEANPFPNSDIHVHINILPQKLCFARDGPHEGDKEKNLKQLKNEDVLEEMGQLGQFGVPQGMASNERDIDDEEIVEANLLKKPRHEKPELDTCSCCDAYGDATFHAIASATLRTIGSSETGPVTSDGTGPPIKMETIDSDVITPIITEEIFQHDRTGQPTKTGPVTSDGSPIIAEDMARLDRTGRPIKTGPVTRMITPIIVEETARLGRTCHPIKDQATPEPAADPLEAISHLSSNPTQPEPCLNISNVNLDTSTARVALDPVAPCTGSTEKKRQEVPVPEQLAQEVLQNQMCAEGLATKLPRLDEDVSLTVLLARVRARNKMLQDAKRYSSGPCPPCPPPCPPPPPKCPPPVPPPCPPPVCPPPWPCPKPCPPPPCCPPPPRVCPPPPCKPPPRCPPPPPPPCPPPCPSKCRCENLAVLTSLLSTFYAPLNLPPLGVVQRFFHNLLAFTLNLRGKDYEPWVPIPSWPVPPAKDAKRPFVCPKEGCPTYQEPCPLQKPCTGMPKPQMPRERNFTPLHLILI